MSNVSGIFPCNTKPQTKLRQKGHAVNRMGSSFSCSSSLHTPSCPTFPCKRLLPRLLSVPDFTSFSHSSQRQHLEFWYSNPTFSQCPVDKEQFCVSHGLCSKSATVTSELQRQTCFCKVGQSEGIYSVVISEALPTVNSVKWESVLLLAVCPHSQ